MVRKTYNPAEDTFSVFNSVLDDDISLSSSEPIVRVNNKEKQNIIAASFIFYANCRK